MERLERAAIKWWIDFPGDPRVDPMEGDTYLGWTDTHKKAFMGGIQAYHAILMEGASEFDEASVREAFPESPYAVYGARWQHSQLAPVIAALRAELFDWKKMYYGADASLKDMFPKLESEREENARLRDNLRRALDYVKNVLRTGLGISGARETTLAEIERLEKGDG